MDRKFKISDIIEELKRLQVEHGDTEVMTLSYVDYSHVNFFSDYPYFDEKNKVVKFGSPDYVSVKVK